MAAAFSIDVYSDMVCPWCFLGKRRLEAAFAERPGLAVDVRWRPFELNPDMPALGVDRGEYMDRKFGDSARVRATQDRLAELGRALGIDYRFEAITRVPNTRAAHALARAAGARQGAVIEALFQAYFEQGRDIGDLGELERIATAAGLDGRVSRAALTAATALAEVAAEEGASEELGIRGVPLFVFAGRWTVSGAQEPATLLAAFDHVAAALGSAGATGAPAGPIRG